ncbi:hypothetical protein JHD47_07490 [Sulfurimonas sp. SAG-AH-194-L11]|nr:hypothetical protein [Sulfurimonas sp. SAG-AH-194-L11]MDF1877661.1 hypothetical protein [Sulfurimonas sp. SAG-AH-194-L11]
MNKKIINQALLFQNNHPTYSKIKDLYLLALEYQDDNSVYFLQAKRGEKSFIKDEVEFFEFLCQTQNIQVRTFQDLHMSLNTENRCQNIQNNGNSKSSFIKIFDNVVVVKKRGEISKLYQPLELYELQNIHSFVAVENGETFLNIDKYTKYFTAEYFVYISGYANSLTREFLKSKEVEFYVDYDIEGMNIYESFECKSKTLHIPKNIELYFKGEKYHNVELYKKQRNRFRKSYSEEAGVIINLIKTYTTVVEQEIIYEAY